MQGYEKKSILRPLTKILNLKFKKNIFLSIISLLMLGSKIHLNSVIFTLDCIIDK